MAAKASNSSLSGYTWHEGERIRVIQQPQNPMAQKKEKKSEKKVTPPIPMYIGTFSNPKINEKLKKLHDALMSLRD